MSERSRALAGAAVLFIAPVVFGAGIAAHPFVRSYVESDVVADAVAGAPERWHVAHLTLSIGIGLLLVAILVIRSHLRGVGEQRWSVIGTPLLIVGGTLLAGLVGAEVTLAAVVESGGDVHAVLATGVTWAFVAGMPLFAIGWVCFAAAFWRAPLLPGVRNRVAILAMLTIPVWFLVPQTSASYAYATAILVVSWLVGHQVATDVTGSRDGWRARREAHGMSTGEPG